MAAATTSMQVISGVPYQVIEVAGHPPRHLQDFVGSAVAFTARRGGLTCEVVGAGVEHDPGVRLHEKTGGSGKDLRVWLITDTADGTFEACTESTF